MNPCSEWKDALIDLVFGDLDDEREMSLNEHLRSCAGCREEESRLGALKSEVRGRDARVPPFLRERVRSHVPGGVGIRGIPALTRPVPAYVALAAGVLGIAAAMLLHLVPEADRRVAPAERVPSQVESQSGRPPFYVVGSYDTEVRTAARDTGSEGEAPRRTPLVADSL